MNDTWKDFRLTERTAKHGFDLTGFFNQVDIKKY